MSVVWIWRWSALAIAFGLFGSAVRAEMITPNSIPNPPSPVSSSGLVYANNLVSTQYTGLGLNFASAAITSLNGVSVWAPTGIAVGAAANSIDYAWGLSGSLVSPGSSNPMTVSSLSVGVIGAPVSVSVYGLPGQTINITPVIQSIGNVQDWTFTGPGISGFMVSPSSPDIGTWGVSAVSFTPTTASAPEPSSLVLAGLGALGLAARWRWRRVRTRVLEDRAIRDAGLNSSARSKSVRPC